MEREEYMEARRSYTSKIIAADKELIKAKELYISKNRIFSDNQRIKIITPESNCKCSGSTTPIKIRFAYVNGVEDNLSGDIKYILSAEKKDGTKSKHSAYYGSNETLEPA